MNKLEQYQCKSYVDDNLEVQDCTCGKCAYDMSVKKWKEAYQNVLKVCEKYYDFKNRYDSPFRDIYDMATSARDHLMLIEWYEKYGLKIDHEHKPYTYNYFRINDYAGFHYYGDAQRDKDAGCVSSSASSGLSVYSSGLL